MRKTSALAVVLVVALATVLTACGGGNGSSANSAGTFVRGLDLTFQGGIGFDPASIRQGWFGSTYPITNSWLKVNGDGDYVPDLAEEVTVIDSSTVTVKMKPDLKFSDGEVLDADAAIQSIERTRNGQAPGLRSNELALIDTMTADSPTEFTIVLSAPRIAAFYPLLADAETTPVSPKTIADPGPHDGDVVTAGPFKLESFEPGVRVRMVKNELYWDAENVKLESIEYRHIGDGAAGMNGLRGGTIDYVSGLNLMTQKDASALTGELVGYNRLLPGTDSALFCMRDGEPMGDVRVRKALNYGTDRERVNELYMGGESEAAVGLVSSSHRLYAEDLANAYPYDVEQAKRLLAEAGYPDGLQLSAVVLPNEAKHFEILQEQWKKIGVDLKLRSATDITAEWYEAKGTNGTVVGVPMLLGIPGAFLRQLTSDAVSNACSYPVPTLDKCVDQLTTLDPSGEEFVAQAVECQEIAFDDLALTVNTVFMLDSGGYNKDRLGEDVVWKTDPLGQHQPDVTAIEVKN